MKVSKKYFISDLDGTLIHKQIGNLLPREEEQQQIKAFVNEGNEFIVATGRSYPDIKTIMENMDVEMSYAIAQNGAEIYHKHELIHSTYLDYNLVEALIEFVNQWGRKIDYFAVTTEDHEMYVKTNTFKGWVHHSRMSSIGKAKLKEGATKQFADQGVGVTKLLFGSLNTRTLKKVEVELEKEFGDSICSFFSSPFSIEICSAGVNKESAMRHILQRENIPEEYVAFIGDSGNDVPVFQTLPNSYVMSHTNKRFKVGHAKEVSRVAHAIQDFLDE